MKKIRGTASAKKSGFIIEIASPSAAWKKALPRVSALARTAATAALEAQPRKKGEKQNPALEVSIAFASNAAVRRLNRVYRGKDKATNVLSFPADAPSPDPHSPRLLGDVVLAYGVAAAESRAENKTLGAHVTHLVIHGVLHLLGYDHLSDHDAVIMERLESDIMARLGFADPYATPAPTPVRARRVTRAASRHPKPKKTGSRS